MNKPETNSLQYVKEAERIYFPLDFLLIKDVIKITIHQGQIESLVYHSKTTTL